MLCAAAQRSRNSSIPRPPPLIASTSERSSAMMRALACAITISRSSKTESLWMIRPLQSTTLRSLRRSTCMVIMECLPSGFDPRADLSQLVPQAALKASTVPKAMHLIFNWIQENEAMKPGIFGWVPGNLYPDGDYQGKHRNLWRFIGEYVQFRCV